MTLLAVTAVVCFTLSRFYPRAYAVARVHVGAKSVEEALTLSIVARSEMVLLATLKKHPEIAKIADGDPAVWLRSHVRATATDDNKTVEIGISGFPKDRQRLQTVVDAIAEQFIDSLGTTRRGGASAWIEVTESVHD